MQQACKTCGYESPETDKFCRQCGGQFSTESEFTSAVTLSHGKGEPSPQMASVGTGRFPPSVGDTIAGDTERYYSPPQYAAPAVNIERPPQYAAPPSNIERPPIYAPLPLPPPPRLKLLSGFMKGMFMFLLVGGLLVTTGMAVFFSQQAEYANRELDRRNVSRDGREQANNRAQDAWEQMEEAIQLTHEAAEKAAAAGATLAISGDKQIDLGRYAYPDAQVEAMISSHGKEALSLITHKSFDDVQKFYEGQFGKPVLQVAAGNQSKKLLFQSPSAPSILIKVEQIEMRKLDNVVLAVKITILHSFLRFPRFNEVQAQYSK
jgi:hypothetical protein